MLVIKNEQIEVFIAEDDTQLVRVLAEIVREAFHEGVSEYSESRLEGMVRIGIKKARSRGFERAEDIAAFVALMFEISPNFDLNDQVDLLLKDDALPASMKIEQILGRVQEETWAELESTYDSRVWFPDQPEKE